MCYHFKFDGGYVKRCKQKGTPKFGSAGTLPLVVKAGMTPGNMTPVGSFRPNGANVIKEIPQKNCPITSRLSR